MNARVGPPRFPLIQIYLGLFQAFESLSFKRRFLRVRDTGLDFAFAESRRLQIVWETRQGGSE